MRNLIYVPILHTQADLGAFAEPVRRITIEKIGQKEWEHNVEAIDEIWESICRAIEGWNLPFPHVRIYQDGLPDCGHELEIVRDLAKAGSTNHQLLLELVGRGATVMGAESAALLLEEYQLTQQISSAGSIEEVRRIEERQRSQSRSLLQRRDRYIAERVNSTLCVGEVGVLFLGLLHSLEEWLATDIEVSYPLGGRPHTRERNNHGWYQQKFSS